MWGLVLLFNQLSFAVVTPIRRSVLPEWFETGLPTAYRTTVTTASVFFNTTEQSSLSASISTNGTSFVVIGPAVNSSTQNTGMSVTRASRKPTKVYTKPRVWKTSSTSPSSAKTRKVYTIDSTSLSRITPRYRITEPVYEDWETRRPNVGRGIYGYTLPPLGGYTSASVDQTKEALYPNPAAKIDVPGPKTNVDETTATPSSSTFTVSSESLRTGAALLTAAGRFTARSLRFWNPQCCTVLRLALLYTPYQNR